MYITFYITSVVSDEPGDGGGDIDEDYKTGERIPL